MSRYVLRLWELAKEIQYSGGDCRTALNQLKQELLTIEKLIPGLPIHWGLMAKPVREQIDFMLIGDWTDDRSFDVHAGSLVESVGRLLFGRTIPANYLVDHPEMMLVGFESVDQEPSANDCLTDGLYPDERCFIWGGERFERLTEKMIKILAVFEEYYQNRFPIVAVKTISSKTGIQFDGAFIRQAFKQNRKGEPKVHPVASVIEKIADGEYRLIDPQKIKV